MCTVAMPNALTHERFALLQSIQVIEFDQKMF